jgi:hypothetical protein
VSNVHEALYVGSMCAAMRLFYLLIPTMSLPAEATNDDVRPDDGGSAQLRNVGLLKRDYKVLYARRQSSSYLVLVS